MDADEVAEAFLALHHSGKVRHFGVSNFYRPQFTLLQLRLPFTLATKPGRNFTGASAAAARRYSRSAAATAYSSDGVGLVLAVVACLTKRASQALRR